MFMSFEPSSFNQPAQTKISSPTLYLLSIITSVVSHSNPLNLVFLAFSDLLKSFGRSTGSRRSSKGEAFVSGSFESPITFAGDGGDEKINAPVGGSFCSDFGGGKEKEVEGSNLNAVVSSGSFLGTLEPNKNPVFSFVVTSSSFGKNSFFTSVVVSVFFC